MSIFRTPLIAPRQGCQQVAGGERSNTPGDKGERNAHRRRRGMTLVGSRNIASANDVGATAPAIGFMHAVTFGRVLRPKRDRVARAATGGPT